VLSKVVLGLGVGVIVRVGVVVAVGGIRVNVGVNVAVGIAVAGGTVGNAVGGTWVGGSATVGTTGAVGNPHALAPSAMSASAKIEMNFPAIELNPPKNILPRAFPSRGRRTARIVAQTENRDKLSCELRAVKWQKKFAARANLQLEQMCDKIRRSKVR
jgi:hypothetical protein